MGKYIAKYLGNNGNAPPSVAIVDLPRKHFCILIIRIGKAIAW